MAMIHHGLPTRRTRGFGVAAALLAVLVPLFVASPASAAVCDDYPNQQAAQEAADTRDADGDGVYCEALPCPCLRPGQGSGGGGGGGKSRPKPKPRAQTIRARVVRVIDGDTIKVRSLENTAKRFYDVRVIGIDTPEVYRGSECGGREASVSMRQLAPTGARVKLRTDTTQSLFDRYGRLLAYVERGRHDLGKAQIRRGWAKVYVYGGKAFRRVGLYRQAQRQARRSDSGVYGLCNGRF
jgi:endonuclease YncB( thermonuclease family)